MTFTEAEVDYLRSQRLGRLATVQPDGSPQVSPVGFAVDAGLGTIDIGGWNMAASRKFRNVSANGRAAFVVDDIASLDPRRVRCVEIRGDAEADFEPGGSGADSPSAIIRLHPRRIISWGLGPDANEGSKRDVAPSGPAEG
jgi:pyridoxamine 5'-phosphate oxidase family protein